MNQKDNFKTTNAQPQETIGKIETGYFSDNTSAKGKPKTEQSSNSVYRQVLPLRSSYAANALLFYRGTIYAILRNAPGFSPRRNKP